MAAELGLQCDIVNFVDDSVLPQLVINGGEVSEVARRLIQYAKFVEQVGSDVILSACSSVGEVVAVARDEVSIPIVRIDDAMAEEAVHRGMKIGVTAPAGIGSREWIANFGLSPDMFPDVHASGTPIGTVSSAMAGVLGLAQGATVSVAGHDHLCASLAVDQYFA